MPKLKATAEERKRGKELGVALKSEREAQNRSQTQLATAAEMPVDNLRGIEQGRRANPGIFTVAAIADALDKPLTYFVAPRKRKRGLP